MSFTRATFRTSLRYVLVDNTIWRDTMLNAWINDAIRDYSNQFPFYATKTIDCTNDIREYSLSSIAPVIVVQSVEYPVGEDPPRYLSRKLYNSDGFRYNPYYDLIGDPPDTLIIGEEPESTEDIEVIYGTIHTIPIGDSSTLTIPDQHAEALRHFVYWKAAQFLEGYAGIDPGRRSQMINALGGGAQHAEKLYYLKMENIIRYAAKSSLAGQWVMDKKDRIY